ncbi:MAG TPA: hypothetical protein VHR40_02720 [Thermoleophilaceae bacterium]|jgi:hypothetical protein|nr:hypothetical protein [Thermoleophilaceae bacterium]
MRGALTFSELPAAAQFQIAVLGPILVGAICGFLLGESAAGWWIAQGAGAVGGVAGGFEHRGARAGARRGLLAGVLFGLGIVIADAISANPHQAKAPDPIALILPIAAVVGSCLGALGGSLRARS